MGSNYSSINKSKREDSTEDSTSYQTYTSTQFERTEVTSIEPITPNDHKSNSTNCYFKEFPADIRVPEMSSLPIIISPTVKHTASVCYL